MSTPVSFDVENSFWGTINQRLHLVHSVPHLAARPWGRLDTTFQEDYDAGLFTEFTVHNDKASSGTALTMVRDFSCSGGKKVNTLISSTSEANKVRKAILDLVESNNAKFSALKGPAGNEFSQVIAIARDAPNRLKLYPSTRLRNDVISDMMNVKRALWTLWPVGKLAKEDKSSVLAVRV